MHDTGCLGPVHWDDPEGWYGEGSGWGTRAHLRQIHFNIWQNQHNNAIRLLKAVGQRRLTYFCSC